MRELAILNKRVERLNNEVELNAPYLIIKTELTLIKEACAKLEAELEEEHKKETE